MKSFILPKAGERFRVSWPVTVNVPVDGGKVEKKDLNSVFQLLTQDEIDGFRDKAVEALSEELPGNSVDTLRSFGPLGIISLHVPTATQFLEEALFNVEKLEQLDGEGKTQPIEFSGEVLNGLCEMSFVRSALLEGYFTFHAGAPEKNSKTSSG